MRKKIIRVLLTGIGGPTPRSIARALKLSPNVYSYYIVGVDCNRLAIGLYDDKYTDARLLVPRSDDKNYWDRIEQIVKEFQIDVAIVQPEAEIEKWALRIKSQSTPCVALVPDYDVIRILRDKAKMNELLEDTGLIPRSIAIDAANINLDKVEKEFKYPFWARSAVGSSGLGALKIDRPNLLEGWLLINENIEKFTISEFLPGRNLACKMLFKDGRLLRVMCAERVNYVMAKTSPSGITGNTSFGRLINSQRAVEVSLSALEMVVKRINAPLHGLFTADLKEDEGGEPKITEINVRNVAFNSVFIAGGINIAEEMVLATLNECEKIVQPALKIFNDSYVFLRDVDNEPITVLESRLLN